MKETITVCSYCRKTLIGEIWVYFYSKMIKSEKNISHSICPACLKKALEEIEAL